MQAGRNLTKIEALEENGHLGKRASAVEKFQKMVLDVRKQTLYDARRVFYEASIASKLHWDAALARTFGTELVLRGDPCY